jgi:DNA processing protein
VEAPAVSGALITARFALEQGRDLWVASSGIGSVRGEGTRKLADDGARVIFEAAEILKEWGIVSEEVFSLDRELSNGAVLASSMAQKLHIDL